MERRAFLRLAASAATLSAVPRVIRAQGAYPSRQITVIVPFPAGGPTDVIARLYADAMSRNLGQPMIIEDVAGAGGTVGSVRAARATPDGYTLLVGHAGTHAANGAFYSKLPYDPVNDFSYIGSMGDAPQSLVAKKGLPSDLKSFADYVRTNQSRMNFGTAGVGSAAHLGGAMFNFALGTHVQPIHYRGGAPAMNDIVAGQIDYMIDMSTTSVPQIQGGNVIPIAVMRPTRLAILPDLPASIESGIPNLNFVIWNVLMAPKNTPRPIIDSLNGSLRKAAADRALRARLASVAVEMPSDDRMSPEGTRAFVQSEVERWVPALKKAGITPVE